MMVPGNRKSNKVHIVVDKLLTLLVTSASEQDQDQVGEQVRAILEVTGNHIEVAIMDPGYTGDVAAI